MRDIPTEKLPYFLYCLQERRQSKELQQEIQRNKKREETKQGIQPNKETKEKKVNKGREIGNEKQNQAFIGCKTKQQKC